MSYMLDVAIIGAGPYGLSLASHLRSMDVRFRIFGKPMQFWREQMPAGMFLKSDASSSDLSDPQSDLTLKRFHDERGAEFSEKQVISREAFAAYGLEFQSRFVPELEDEQVVSVEPDRDGYILRLSNQELVRTRQVVLAIGISSFCYLPPELDALPLEVRSHSAVYGPLDALKGKKVAVVGSGASAIDLALELVDNGIEATIISRRDSIPYQASPAPKKPSLYARIRWPQSGIGGGWRNKICADTPWLVHALPAALRSHIFRTVRPPAPPWFTEERVTGRIPVLLNRTLHSASAADGKVTLTLTERDGTTQSCEFDHVIGATGYKADIQKLPFLDESIRRNMRTQEGFPVLSRGFESSCPGLYFIGHAAGMSFGPVMRFVYGAGFTMKTIVRHLVKSRAHNASTQSVVALGSNN